MTRIVSNKIELEGRIIAQPELRVTPAGTPLLRLRVDCGDHPGELVMPVIISGDEARALAGQLSAGSVVRLSGVLRVQLASPTRSAAGSVLEVAAHTIGSAQSG
jgi:primosomal replication protein N